MTDNGPSRESLQRDVASMLLAVIGDHGFVLAGAGAIREHGFTNRPTADVDLFGPPLTTADQFATVLELVEQTVVDAGYTVERARSFPQFARLRLSRDGEDILDVDLALNWRADSPVLLAVGPVLSERDAIAGKLSAVQSRGEVRDFLDLDAIRLSGRITDDALLALGTEHDDGFDPQIFAEQLSRVVGFLPSEAAAYQVGPDDFVAIQQRLLAWANHIRRKSTRPGFTAG